MTAARASSADHRTVDGGSIVATHADTPTTIAKASWPRTIGCPRIMPSNSGTAIATAAVTPNHRARSGGRCFSSTHTPTAVAATATAA